MPIGKPRAQTIAVAIVLFPKNKSIPCTVKPIHIISWIFQILCFKEKEKEKITKSAAQEYD